MCPTEIIAFSDRIEEFRAIDAEVVACSVDSQFTHLAWYVLFPFYLCKLLVVNHSILQSCKVQTNVIPENFSIKSIAFQFIIHMSYILILSELIVCMSH